MTLATLDKRLAELTHSITQTPDSPFTALPDEQVVPAFLTMQRLAHAAFLEGIEEAMKLNCRRCAEGVRLTATRLEHELDGTLPGRVQVVYCSSRFIRQGAGLA